MKKILLFSMNFLYSMESNNSKFDEFNMDNEVIKKENKTMIHLPRLVNMELNWNNDLNEIQEEDQESQEVVEDNQKSQNFSKKSSKNSEKYPRNKHQEDLLSFYDNYENSQNDHQKYPQTFSNSSNPQNNESSYYYDNHFQEQEKLFYIKDNSQYFNGDAFNPLIPDEDSLLINNIDNFDDKFLMMESSKDQSSLLSKYLKPSETSSKDNCTVNNYKDLTNNGNLSWDHLLSKKNINNLSPENFVHKKKVNSCHLKNSLKTLNSTTLDTSKKISVEDNNLFWIPIKNQSNKKNINNFILQDGDYSNFQPLIPPKDIQEIHHKSQDNHGQNSSECIINGDFIEQLNQSSSMYTATIPNEFTMISSEKKNNSIRDDIYWARNEIPLGSNEIRNSIRNEIPLGSNEIRNSIRNEIPLGRNEVPNSIRNEIPLGRNEIPLRRNEIPFGSNEFSNGLRDYLKVKETDDKNQNNYPRQNGEDASGKYNPHVKTQDNQIFQGNYPSRNIEENNSKKHYKKNVKSEDDLIFQNNYLRQSIGEDTSGKYPPKNVKTEDDIIFQNNYPNQNMEKNNSKRQFHKKNQKTEYEIKDEFIFKYDYPRQSGENTSGKYNPNVKNQDDIIFQNNYPRQNMEKNNSKKQFHKKNQKTEYEIKDEFIFKYDYPRQGIREDASEKYNPNVKTEDDIIEDLFFKSHYPSRNIQENNSKKPFHKKNIKNQDDLIFPSNYPRQNMEEDDGELYKYNIPFSNARSPQKPSKIVFVKPKTADIPNVSMTQSINQSGEFFFKFNNNIQNNVVKIPNPHSHIINNKINLILKNTIKPTKPLDIIWQKISNNIEIIKEKFITYNSMINEIDDFSHNDLPDESNFLKYFIDIKNKIMNLYDNPDNHFKEPHYIKMLNGIHEILILIINELDLEMIYILMTKSVNLTLPNREIVAKVNGKIKFQCKEKIKDDLLYYLYILLDDGESFGSVFKKVVNIYYFFFKNQLIERDMIIKSLENNINNYREQLEIFFRKELDVEKSIQEILLQNHMILNDDQDRINGLNSYITGTIIPKKIETYTQFILEQQKQEIFSNKFNNAIAIKTINKNKDYLLFIVMDDLNYKIDIHLKYLKKFFQQQPFIGLIKGNNDEYSLYLKEFFIINFLKIMKFFITDIYLWLDNKNIFEYII